MTDTSKQKAPVVSATKGFSNTTSKPRHSTKSSATEAQYRRIIEALRIGPKTSHDLRVLGAYHPAGRVKELNDKFGFVIDSDRVSLWDAWGFEHRNCARYHLLREPDNADALLGLARA
ncbi:helix-turn-helix domain-containing protein [Comamonas flocculans]|uniref:Helix-turn-helix domain-containing protein n=1 Tax=Comamonas flocculans TaxID=2597701 RepID=A0A5B8RTV5_9BURK|nr:helix-turn-helix domain-containing protein [Comamonas flocculans]QEA12094.1 hypothetical protein FOZ74_03025 [Comamonas flocculans]